MTILQVYVRKRELTGEYIITNKDGVPLSPFDMGAIDLIWYDLGNDTVKIISNAYGPIGIFTKLIFEEEFNVPEVTREELEATY